MQDFPVIQSGVRTILFMPFFQSRSHLGKTVGASRNHTVETAGHSVCTATAGDQETNALVMRLDCRLPRVVFCASSAFYRDHVRELDGHNLVFRKNDDWGLGYSVVADDGEESHLSYRV